MTIFKAHFTRGASASAPAGITTKDQMQQMGAQSLMLPSSYKYRLKHGPKCQYLVCGMRAML